MLPSTYIRSEFNKFLYTLYSPRQRREMERCVRVLIVVIYDVFVLVYELFYNFNFAISGCKVQWSLLVFVFQIDMTPILQ